MKHMKIRNITFLILAFMSMNALSKASSFGGSDKYAWDQNAGWISFRHDQPSSPSGVVFGGAFLSGYAYSANTGWINFGDGSPSNGYSYSNGLLDHGVNHDGVGNLSGYAWSANTGWLNFEWASSSDLDRPRVDLTSGEFFGYAWSPNLGWLNLGTGTLTTATMEELDTDGDGIADHWEWQNFGDLTSASATTDSDGDGIVDLNEYISGTDPNDLGSYLKVVTHSYSADFTAVTLEFTTTRSRSYRIEYDDDLGLSPVGSWTDSVLGTFTPSSGSTTTKTILLPADSKMFFRAVAELPLTP